jgi:hypothetical protein
MQLQPGYAETSTRKYPKEAETVMVVASDCVNTTCQGEHRPGTNVWRYKVKGQKRYYFQHGFAR